jgi:hypothetical protein
MFSSLSGKVEQQLRLEDADSTRSGDIRMAFSAKCAALQTAPCKKAGACSVHTSMRAVLCLVLCLLLHRYKAEKLQLDGRLFWHPRCAAQLPELESDGGFRRLTWKQVVPSAQHT